jgi:hypothetical protein
VRQCQQEPARKENARYVSRFIPVPVVTDKPTSPRHRYTPSTMTVNLSSHMDFDANASAAAETPRIRRGKLLLGRLALEAAHGINSPL